MKFFEVRFVVRAREVALSPIWRVTEPMSSRKDELEHELAVTLHMGDSATPEDAVKELARRLEEVCNDASPYSGG